MKKQGPPPLSTETYKDGEVIGIDTDGGLVIWDSFAKAGFNCGESIEEFGPANLTSTEKQRLAIGFSNRAISAAFKNIQEAK